MFNYNDYEEYDYDTGYPDLPDDEIYIDLQKMLNDDFAREIPDFPGYYGARDGSIISTKHGKIRFLRGHVGKNGYLVVVFRHGGESYMRYIHRIIAELFIPNPKRHPFVRHLDDNRRNNFEENLAWGTPQDNVNDSIRNDTFIGRKLVAFKNGKEYFFRSQQEASRVLNVNQAHISDVMNGKRRTAGGYRFYDYYK